MSQATPRKFSEKIAILERKQNEEQDQFNAVMRDVRTITSTTSRASSAANSPLFTSPSSVGSDQQRQPTPQPSPQHQSAAPPSYGAPPSNESSCGSKLSPEGPHPLTGNWNRAGGSLPNVHQMVQQPMASGIAPYGWSPSWSNVPAATNGQAVQHLRTRSPGAPHFHPYRNGGGPTGRHDQQQRMSQDGRQSVIGTMVGVHLQPPDPTWSKARSDPAIHTAAMMSAVGMDPGGFMSAYPFYPGGMNPCGAGGGQWPPGADGKMFSGPSTAPTSAAIMPPNLPMAFFPSYPTPLGGNQLQQMFMPPVVSAAGPQQLGSPSSSTMSAQQQTAAFMASREMAGAGMNSAGMPQQQQMGLQQQQQNNHQGSQQQHQQMNNNFAAFQNSCTIQQQQQQQMMNCSNTRGPYQQQQTDNNSFNSMVAGGFQMSNNGQQAPPPMYPGHQSGGGMSMKMATSAAQAHANNVQQRQQLSMPQQSLMMSQSQSAPTSPITQNNSSSMENNPLLLGRQQQWLASRHFSASPDGQVEVPNICVTGTDGSLDIDCFQDLQDLHLDSETLQMLKDPAANEQVDPACETQLLS